MQAATWQRYVQMGERDAVDFEAALLAADSAECDEDFELGEAWDDEDHDPLDDEDPE